MAADLLRSNIEASKRVFWIDLLQINNRSYKKIILLMKGREMITTTVVLETLGISALVLRHCSGLAGVVIPIAISGLGYFTRKGYQRLSFTTESFPANLVGFKTVSKSECIASNSPIKVMIGHHGGGANSHMACIIDGWHMESNGDYGICGGPNWNTPAVRNIITPIDDDGEWNEWWVYEGAIKEDTTRRQPMGYPLVLDYSGGPGKGPDGHISGVALKAAGVTAVCRYLYGAGTSLQYKQLTLPEANDLQANGIEIVSNFEQGTSNALGGEAQGQIDVQAALTAHNAAGGPSPAQIYFSVDFDASPDQQDAINAYFRAINNILGVENTGIYGGYWPLSRCLDAGVVALAWQTEAWSGGNIDSRINLLQRNGLGYQTVEGVQCDINEAHTDNFAAWGTAAPLPQPQPTPINPPSDPFILWYKGASDRELLEYITAQLGPGDPAWASKGSTLRDEVYGIFQGENK